MTLGRILHFGAIEQVSDFFDGPNMIRDTSFHRRGDAQGLANPAEIVVHEVEGHSSRVIVYPLLAPAFQGHRAGEDLNGRVLLWMAQLHRRHASGSPDRPSYLALGGWLGSRLRLRIRLGWGRKDTGTAI